MRGTVAKKAALFGLFGALGCLAGWLVGEGFLLAALPRNRDDSTPSLATKPVPSSPVLAELPAPPPPLDKDFAERLRKAGAGSGDVTLSLKWDNYNDLDLHCIDPTGEEIWFQNKRGKTGGHLDVDRNADRRETREPVENIFWPSGKARPGRYRVYVNYFRRQGDPDPTRYQFSVRWDGERREGSGEISSTEPKRLIFDFELKPRLRLAIAPEVAVNQDGANVLPIKIARDRFTGPVTVRVEGDLKGVTAQEVHIATADTDAQVKLAASRTAAPGTRSLRVVADGGRAEERQEFKLIIAELPSAVISSRWSWPLVLVIGAWTALLALGLALALVIVQNWHLGRSLLPANQARVVIPGGLAAGFVGGVVAQALLGLLAQASFLPQLGFLIGWLLLGALVGGGLVFFIPNLDPKRSTIAGAGGGALGALAFILMSQLGEMAGRFVGAAILGAAIGLATVLVEMAFRRAWLQVRRGPREVVTVNLGERAVTVGSDGKTCTIYVMGIAPIAYRYKLRGGQVTLEDVATGQAQTVTTGHSQKIGAVEVTVCGETEAKPIPVERPLAAAPVASAAPPQLHPDGCPGCGRTVPGQPGRRYCIICERTF